MYVKFNINSVYNEKKRKEKNIKFLKPTSVRIKVSLIPNTSFYFFMSKSSLISLLTKSFSKEQAIRELQWIKNELPENKWLNACNLRSNHVPLQYILGNQPFGKLDLICREGVLIPRLDTEDWVIESSKVLKDVKINGVLDYCTGSGCIGLSYASELNQVSIVDCVDFKDDAIILTNDNYKRNKDSILCDVRVSKGDLFDSYIPNDQIYNTHTNNNLLVSNPPYIPLKDLHTDEVEESVLKYEPREALLGDLEFYEALCENILLKNNSFNGFIFELGYNSQVIKVRELLNPKIWSIGIRNDINGKLRNVIGWKKQSSLNVLQKIVHKKIL